MRKSFLPINKELAPYTFEIVLANEVFEILVKYNAHADLFTLALYKDGEEVCAGEPLVCGVPLWKDVYSAGKFPAINIIPCDLSGDEADVTWTNLGETVFLYIDDGEEPLMGG